MQFLALVFNVRFYMFTVNCYSIYVNLTCEMIFIKGLLIYLTDIKICF